jgi:hypothetical protein
VGAKAEEHSGQIMQVTHSEDGGSVLSVRGGQVTIERSGTWTSSHFHRTPATPVQKAGHPYLGTRGPRSPGETG